MSADALLATKLAVPAAPRGAIERPHLLARLDEASERAVTLVAAPAGSGKSALVSAWARSGRAPGPVAWLSLDATDADPERFWDGVRAAIGGRSPPLTLVLDDLHEAGAAPLADLERLLRFPPPGLHLVLVTRADPHVGLPRLRVQGRLAELRAGDLAFTREEVGALLAAGGVALAPDDVARLWQRTEGWAAALRLAALSLKDHPDPAQFVARFAGTDATVSDYLVSEVLARQSDQVRDFLLRTSIVDVVSADLADALTGETSGHRLLSALEHGEALIAPVDEHGVWHRYHPLFAELLRAELQWERPEEAGALHRRAAVWLAAHGDPARAARHAARGGAWDVAAEVVGERWLHLLIEGEAGALRPVLEGMPPARVEEHPEAALALGGLLLAEGDHAAAERYLGAARKQVGLVPPARRARFALTMAATRLYASRRRGSVRAALVAARELLTGDAARDGDLLPAELRALVLVNLGIVELWTGEVGAAVGHLQRGHAAAAEAQREWLVLQATAHLALAAALRGEVGRAAREAEEALALAERRGWSVSWPAGVAYETQAAIAIQRARLDEAERLLALAGAALRDTQERPLRAAHALNRALVLGDRGQPGAALDALRAGLDELGDWPLLAGLRDSFAAQEALLCSALGEREAARAALGRGAASSLARGRLALLDGRPVAAREAVAGARDHAAGTMLPVRAEAWLLDALALDALAEHDAASGSLERALDLAEPAGLRRPIVIYGPLVRPLLSRQRHRGTAHPVLVGEALAEIERHGSRRAPLLLREPLSDREVSVLRFLPTMMSNQEIAGELFVSVNTVKTHLKAIYRKLDAPGRREAVSRAREAGLLP